MLRRCKRACCRRLLVYTAISAVCVCLEPCDRTQVSDNGVSFSSFLFIQPLAHFFFFALQLFLFSLVYFLSKMLGQIQTCTHFTSTHYNMLVCLRFLLSIADNITLLTQTKNFNRAELDPGLRPWVSLQLVKPLTLKGH